MNYFDLYSSYPDRTIAAAWDSQVKEADNTPWLADTLTEYGDELFARFAACYAELRALPRSARRALQRRIARSNELAAVLPEYLQHGGRRLQHRMAWSLTGAALLLALGQGVATAATITVTTNDPRIIPDGQCSLVEAIVNANNDAATHPDCAAGSGVDTVVLPANGNLMLSTVYCNTYGQFCSPGGLPPITSQITIEGNGAIIARQGNAPTFSLIAVRNSGNLMLQSVTLSGGSGSAGVHNSGTLSIKNSIISGNTSGGVSNGGTLTIENSIIANNRSNFGGGGLYNGGGTTIINSTISGNTAGSRGGAVYNNFHGTLTIENSTISGNSGSSGGGLFNSAGSLTLTNSTISGNIGGGLINSFGSTNYFYCYYDCSRGGTLTLNRSLIAGNQAPVAPEIQNISTVAYVSIVNANNFNLFGSMATPVSADLPQDRPTSCPAFS
jgi:hypothetical protein